MMKSSKKMRRGGEKIWPRRYFACPFVLRQGTHQYHCLICGCVIYSYSALHNHIDGKRHKTAVEQYGCDISALKDDYYYCSLCDCIIPYYTNIFTHLTGKRHQNILHSESPTTDWSTCDYFVCPYISSEGFDKYYCTLCGCYMADKAAFQSHIGGQLHANAVAMFGLDISPIGEDYYHCGLCDCDIPHYKNVYLHITGQRHQSTMYQNDEQRSHGNCEEETEERQDTMTISEIKESQKPAFIFDDSTFESDDEDNRGSGNEETEKTEDLREENEGSSKMVDRVESTTFYEDVHYANSEEEDRNSPYEMNKLRNRESSREDIEEWRLDSVFNAGAIKTILHKPTVTEYAEEENKTRGEQKIGETEQIRRFHSYTILPRPADAETETKKEISGWKNLPHKDDPPKRLNMLSWQLSTCKNFLHSSTAKITAKNEDDKNITEIPMNRDNIWETASGVLQKNRIEAGPQSDSPISSRNSELVEKLEFLKTNEQYKSLGEAPPRVSTTHRIKFLHNSTGPQGEKTAILDVDINGNKSSNDFLDNDLAEDRDDEEFTKIPSVRHLIDAVPILHRADRNVNDLSWNLATSTMSSASIVEDSLSQRSSACVERENFLEDHSQKEDDIMPNIYEDIYDMNEKRTAVKQGLMLSVVIDSRNIYCLICHKVLEAVELSYYEHLCDVEHCASLEEQKKDHALSELVPGGYSELHLANQYMVEISEDIVHCIICGGSVDNSDHALKAHMEESSHRRRCEKMHKKAKQCFELVEPRMRCDWYKIQKYLCEACSANFDSETDFLQHLKRAEHANAVMLEKLEGRLVFDFCALCGLLWYGHRCTYRFHRDSSRHIWLSLMARYKSVELPASAKMLLATPEEYIEKVIKFVGEAAVAEEMKTKVLIDDLENSVKLMFPQAKAYVFNAGLIGLEFSDGDIDVFLDYGNDQKISSSQKLRDIAIVHKCLSDNRASWNTEEIQFRGQLHTIKANHRKTGLSCRISSENGLAVESSEFVKSLVDIVPVCRKILIFLKQWMDFCHLTGDDGITIHALCWLVIFFLQKESILPSMAILVETEHESPMIAARRIVMSHDSVHVEAVTIIAIRELLMKFFMFYSNFDYRYDVACPLLGGAVKKRAFVDYQNLPKEMKSYNTSVKNSDTLEPFVADAPFCLQDPFDLQANLTQTMSKARLSEFRACCSKSLLLLDTSHVSCT